MVRWLAVLFFSCILTSQLNSQASQEQVSRAQTTAPEPATAGQAGSAAESAPAKTGYPFDQFTDFSAIMVGSVMAMDEREAHIYRWGNLLRMQGTEGRGYFITDLATSDTYGITMLGCVEDRHPYFRTFPFLVTKPDRKVERVAAGTETVDGHVCKVEDVTISSKDLLKPMKLRFWESEDLRGFPIKVEVFTANGGSKIIRYKDVVLGPVDPTLFTHSNKCAGLPKPPAKKPSKGNTPPAGPPG
ncbi:MAG: hypothetical protein ABSG02_15645 [Terriglobales bacterium]